ncbi:MAG: SMC-Scp complex subunit ScpB [Acidimicrobiales bacterium]
MTDPGGGEAGAGAGRPGRPGEGGGAGILGRDEERAVEALVMVAEGPVPVGLLAELLERPRAAVEAACRALAAAYEEEGRGFVLAEVAGGWRFQSHPDLAQMVERYARGRDRARLSPAALETLAIVAYKQPISRAQVSAVRGVDVEGVLRTLVQRGYVQDVGRDPGPGQAVLYGTTVAFLERLGLARIADLPPLAGFVPGAEVVEALEEGLRGP